MTELSFRHALDKVKFTAMLMVIRLDNPDDQVPFTFFVYNDQIGHQMTPVSTSFFDHVEGLHSLSTVNFPVRVRDVEAKYAFIVFTTATGMEGSNLEDMDETMWVHGVSADEEELWGIGLKRQRFGGPILERPWKKKEMSREDFYGTVDLLGPTQHALKDLVPERTT